MNALTVLADVVPLLGDILRMGIGLFAVIVATGLSVITIAIAWVAYRPVLGIGLIVVAGVIVFGTKQLGKRSIKPSVT